ncbi:MAG: RtcB family protein [Mycobacterium sp.]
MTSLIGCGAISYGDTRVCGVKQGHAPRDGFLTNPERRAPRPRPRTVRGSSRRGLAEEKPQAHKDIDAVIETSHQAGLARKVARLIPLGVVKG